MNQEKIGKIIASARKEQNLTQEELAEKLNVTSKTISRWENGKSIPDISLFNDICNILNITLEELLSGEYKRNGNNETINFIKYLKKKYNFKLIIIVIITTLILIIILSLLFKDYKLEYSTPLDYYQEITKINDNTKLYSNFQDNYYIKYNKITLKEALENKKITIENILDKMILENASNDGGSLYYKSKDEQISVAVCNSLQGNHNIYISYKMDYGICTYDFQKRLNHSCLVDKLTSIISDKENKNYDVPITEISDGVITSWKIVRNDNVGAFAIIKTEDNKALTDFKNYFSNIDSNYKYTNIFETFYVFISNGNDINLEELNECIK